MTGIDLEKTVPQSHSRLRKAFYLSALLPILFFLVNFLMVLLYGELYPMMHKAHIVRMVMLAAVFFALLAGIYLLLHDKRTVWMMLVLALHLYFAYHLASKVYFFYQFHGLHPDLHL